MEITKDHFDEVFDLLESEEFFPSTDGWTDEAPLISVKDGSFCVIFEKEEILLSFEHSLPPDTASLVLEMFFKKSSVYSSIVIMENFYFSEKKNTIVYGEEAAEEYLEDLKEVIIEEYLTEKKFDYIMKNTVSPCREC